MKASECPSPVRPSSSTANTREAKESPDPADEETGPRLAKLGGACCKEVGSAPQILARLPLCYRNTDGAALSFTPRPLKSAAANVAPLVGVLEAVNIHGWQKFSGS